MSRHPGVVVAERFLTAIYQGDSVSAWNLFSNGARQFIVARGVRRGLTDDLGKALLEGTADKLERTEFLGDVLSGLETDLLGVDLSRVSVSDAVDSGERGSVRVRFVERFVVAKGPPLPPLQVGSIDLIWEEETWKVDRLRPYPG